MKYKSWVYTTSQVKSVTNLSPSLLCMVIDWDIVNWEVHVNTNTRQWLDVNYVYPPVHIHWPLIDSSSVDSSSVDSSSVDSSSIELVYLQHSFTWQKRYLKLALLQVQQSHSTSNSFIITLNICSCTTSLAFQLDF